MPYNEPERAAFIAQTIEQNPMNGAGLLRQEIYQAGQWGGVGAATQLINDVQYDMSFYAGASPFVPQLRIEGVGGNGCYTGGAEVFVQYNVNTGYGLRPQRIFVADLQTALPPGYGPAVAGGTAFGLNVHFGGPYNGTNINAFVGSGGYRSACPVGYPMVAGNSQLSVFALQVNVNNVNNGYSQFGNFNTNLYNNYAPVWRNQQINQLQWQPEQQVIAPPALTAVQQKQLFNQYNQNVQSNNIRVQADQSNVQRSAVSTHAAEANSNVQRSAVSTQAGQVARDQHPTSRLSAAGVGTNGIQSTDASGATAKPSQNTSYTHAILNHAVAPATTDRTVANSQAQVHAPTAAHTQLKIETLDPRKKP